MKNIFLAISAALAIGAGNVTADDGWEKFFEDREDRYEQSRINDRLEEIEDEQRQDDRREKAQEFDRWLDSLFNN